MYHFQDDQRDSLDVMKLSIQRLTNCTKRRLQSEEARNKVLKKELQSLRQLKESKSYGKCHVSIWSQTPEVSCSQTKQVSDSRQPKAFSIINTTDIDKEVSAITKDTKIQEKVVLQDKPKKTEPTSLKCQLLTKGYPVTHKQIKSKPLLAVKPIPPKSAWINSDKIPLRFRNV